jgi:hypothetical protein
VLALQDCPALFAAGDMKSFRKRYMAALRSCGLDGSPDPEHPAGETADASQWSQRRPYCPCRVAAMHNAMASCRCSV